MRSLILHTIELATEQDTVLGQFSLTLHLSVPSSRIATDIRTGYPSLMQQDRIKINHFVSNHLSVYQQKYSLDDSKRILSYMDEWIHLLLEDLEKLLNQLPSIEINSLSIESFTDYPYSPAKIIKKQ